ncbi:glycosyltransferase [Clostridium sp. AL.422]|uniref:glycosyltransferase n=1 Tax=Clostridium TaxID=1485 RepID=UPI00293DCD1F|nr:MULTISPECIES: glycosyltransferase [unclassified Clostridium]MDV4152776.1 glycosyltransferase [Clostridium sp. AL.422]
MDNIVLSIVVPVYNVEKYIDGCINSVIENYCNGIEVILVDDGSKDSSSKTCDEYAAKYDYISVIHKENGGLSSARNAGIRKAQGEYIWFIDSDDYVKDGSIEKIIKYTYNNTDLILGSYCDVLPNGQIIEDELPQPEKGLKAYEYFYNIGSCSYAAVRSVCKRSFILENNLFFTEGIYHEDEDWTPRVLCSAKTFCVMTGTVYYYRVGNPQSIITTPNPKKIYDKLFVATRMYDRIKDEKIDGIKKSFLQYRMEHNFTAAINEVVLYNGSERNKIVKAIKDKIYLLDEVDTTKSKLILNSIKLIGIENTSRLLRVRNKSKKYLKK